MSGCKVALKRMMPLTAKPLCRPLILGPGCVGKQDQPLFLRDSGLHFSGGQLHTSEMVSRGPVNWFPNGDRQISNDPTVRGISAGPREPPGGSVRTPRGVGGSLTHRDSCGESALVTVCSYVCMRLGTQFSGERTYRFYQECAGVRVSPAGPGL